MNKKMEGFLRSLGLNDLSRFDMDFSLVAIYRLSTLRQWSLRTTA